MESAIHCLWIVGDSGSRTVQLAEDKEGGMIERAEERNDTRFVPGLRRVIGPMAH